MPVFTPRPVAAAVAVSLCLLFAPRPARADNVHFALSDPSLELWNRTRNVAMVPVRVGRYGTRMERSFVYAPLCPSTPCTVNMAPGTHALAMSEPGGSLIEGQSYVNIEGESTVTGDFHDRSSLRGAGYLTLVAGMISGTALFFAGSHADREQLTLDPGFATLGAGLFLGSLIGGLALIVQRDTATFAVTPVFALGPSSKRENGASGMNGLALTVRF